MTYERIRVAREVHIRTAMEDPGFAEREFERWKADRDRWRARETQATAWAKVAWVAEGKMLAMGRNLDKVSRRLGKQREINRAQRRRIKELESEIREDEGVSLEKSDREWLAKRLEPSPFEERMRRLDEHMSALEKALGWYAYQEGFAERHGRWGVAPAVRVARDALEGKEDE